MGTQGLAHRDGWSACWRFAGPIPRTGRDGAHHVRGGRDDVQEAVCLVEQSLSQLVTWSLMDAENDQQTMRRADQETKNMRILDLALKDLWQMLRDKRSLFFLVVH